LLQPSVVHAAQAQGVVRDQPSDGMSPIRAAREFILHRLLQGGLRIGEGFYGFANRSGSRCRKSGALESSRYAAESTMVLSHEHLLHPNDGSSSVDEVLDVFESLNRELGF
jgi:hypothetical protein